MKPCLKCKIYFPIEKYIKDKNYCDNCFEKHLKQNIAIENSKIFSFQESIINNLNNPVRNYRADLRKNVELFLDKRKFKDRVVYYKILDINKIDEIPDFYTIQPKKNHKSKNSTEVKQQKPLKVINYINKKKQLKTLLENALAENKDRVSWTQLAICLNNNPSVCGLYCYLVKIGVELGVFTKINNKIKGKV